MRNDKTIRQNQSLEERVRWTEQVNYLVQQGYDLDEIPSDDDKALERLVRKAQENAASQG